MRSRNFYPVPSEIVEKRFFRKKVRPNLGPEVPVELLVVLEGAAEPVLQDVLVAVVLESDVGLGSVPVVVDQVLHVAAHGLSDNKKECPAFKFLRSHYGD